MFSPHLVTEKDFTIADNHFERNEARSGGGIALGADFQQINRTENLEENILTESVIFCRNTFVQNRGVRGGGMYLGPGEWAFSYNTCHQDHALKFEGHGSV